MDSPVKGESNGVYSELLFTHNTPNPLGLHTHIGPALHKGLYMTGTSFVRTYLDYFVFYVCDRHDALINQVLSGKKKLGFFPSSFGGLSPAKR